MDHNDLIVVSCTSCTQRFRVRRQSAGRAVKCPHCSQTVNVPSDAGGQAQPAPQPAANTQANAAGAGQPPPSTPQRPAPGPTQPAGDSSAQQFNLSPGESPQGASDAASSATPNAAQSPQQQSIFNPAAFPSPSPQSSTAAQAPATESGPVEPNPFQAPSFDPAAATISGLPARRRYPALQVIRTMYLVMACLVIIGWVIYMLSTLTIAARTGAVGAWFLVSLVPTASAAISATVLIAIAEGIKLALDIQSNTLTTARNTSHRAQ